MNKFFNLSKKLENLGLSQIVFCPKNENFDLVIEIGTSSKDDSPPGNKLLSD